MMLKNKRAVEVLPVFMLLGMIVGFSVFVIHARTNIAEHDTNPFYGGLGDRELSLIAIYSQIQMDLTSLDIIALHSLRATIKEQAYSLYMDEDCAQRDGIPIVNLDDDCLDRFNLEEAIKRNTRAFSSELYPRQVASNLPFPFSYDFHFVQGDAMLTVQAYARDNMRYPINPEKFGERPSPRASSPGMSFDLSRDCHYVRGSSAEAGAGRDDLECEGNYCRGPCPDNMDMRIVPYMNQCHIPECEAGFCNIDDDEICNVGCGFKSVQMAYAYYGYGFSELDSIYTSNIISLIDDMEARRPSDAGITRNRPDNPINPDSDEHSERVVFSNGASNEVKIATEIRSQDYDAIIDMLEEGLVRLELSSEPDVNPRIDDCDSSNDKGYCINRHFVLATAGNQDFLIIHDPYTRERPYRTGMNLVVSREFIKDYWTGYYSHIKGDAA